MKNLFFLLLLTPLLFTACSSDDDKDDNKATIVVESEAISYNKIRLSWVKIAETYRYQVFFKAEGASEWQTSDPFTPIDQSTTATFELSDLSADTKYTMVVKAFKDSSDNSVIGESKEFTVTTPKAPV
ncbi:MAG: fibronectin type III domain-containing protein [Dysgonomonas sp.]